VGVYQNNLFIEDPLPKKAIAALLSAATVASNLVTDLPQARANSANKFFDTLAAGKPIFLNHGGWMHDLVTNHECGLPLWQKPVEVVAAELDAKMHDKDWLEKAGKAARTLAETSFDRDLLARQLISVLQSAVDGSPERAAEIAPGNYFPEGD
jgi:glycosyltransferase involved in cell wall biosynthesis